MQRLADVLFHRGSSATDAGRIENEGLVVVEHRGGLVAEIGWKLHNGKSRQIGDLLDDVEIPVVAREDEVVENVADLSRKVVQLVVVSLGEGGPIK